jgi:hypothetical protein
MLIVRSQFCSVQVTRRCLYNCLLSSLLSLCTNTTISNAANALLLCLIILSQIRICRSSKRLARSGNVTLKNGPQRKLKHLKKIVYVMKKEGNRENRSGNVPGRKFF